MDFFIIALFVLAASCSKSTAQQTVASDAIPSPSAASMMLPDASKMLPALNKTASGEKIAFSMHIPRLSMFRRSGH